VNYKNFKNSISILLMVVFFSILSYAQKPMRAGTTAANFLEIGYGVAGNSMGDAFVSISNDLSAAYWNPAGLALLDHNEAMFSYQPWIADINCSFVAAGINLQNIGTLALSIISTNYGEMEVTSLTMQEGTGEKYNANDLAISLSFGRKLADWFSFGVTGKYLTSNIWNCNANAFAFDLGVIINTGFFSQTEEKNNGLNIGMSIANYGSHYKFDGMDLLNPIDISVDEHGNYRDVPGKFELQEWELPLIFRIGASYNAFVMDQHTVTLSVDALHPNNNSESVNAGVQYCFSVPSFGKFFARCGYKGVFMDDSEYGLSFGFGVMTNIMNNKSIKVEYAYRDIGLLGKTHNYGIVVAF
jgi:hypothetical protein